MEQDIEKFLQHMKRLAKKVGFSLTRQREDICRTLFFLKAPFNADDIYNEIVKSKMKNITIPTIYKTLKLLEEMDVISPIIIGKSKFYSLMQMKVQNYMLCYNCKKIVGFYDKTLEEDIKRMTKKHDFLSYEYKISLYGICEDCQ